MFNIIPIVPNRARNSSGFKKTSFKPLKVRLAFLFGSLSQPALARPRSERTLPSSVGRSGLETELQSGCPSLPRRSDQSGSCNSTAKALRAQFPSPRIFEERSVFRLVPDILLPLSGQRFRSRKHKCFPVTHRGKRD